MHHGRGVLAPSRGSGRHQEGSGITGTECIPYGVSEGHTGAQDYPSGKNITDCIAER